MQFTPAIVSAILLFSGGAFAAPIAQLAGEGAAANSILSSTDNGVGFGVEGKPESALYPCTDLHYADAEDNTANLITSLKGGAPALARRQLAGEGAAANSILSSTDNGLGYGVENAEDNTANLITSIKGGTAVPAAPKLGRRQGDKIANGLKAIGNAAGVSTVTDPVGNAGDSIDGSLTSGAANIGADTGATEESTLEATGSAVPKFRRQGDKISNGLGAVGNAAGAGAVTDPVQQAGDSLDGTLTSGAANAGASVGNTEETTLENIGSAVPK